MCDYASEIDLHCCPTPLFLFLISNSLVPSSVNIVSTPLLFFSLSSFSLSFFISPLSLLSFVSLSALKPNPFLDPALAAPFKVGDDDTACIEVEVGDNHHVAFVEDLVGTRCRWTVGSLCNNLGLNLA